MADSSSPRPTSVLFVCLGNICRSPMAEGVFRHLTAAHNPPFHVDSCGTGAYHIGSDPDDRTMSTLAENGIADYAHAARQFRSPQDFEQFDYIFAMDGDNLQHLKRLREREAARRQRAAGKQAGQQGQQQHGDGLGRVMLWGDFGGKKGEEVIDPYYGARNGFSVAYAQMVRFTEGFLESLKDNGERL